MRQHLSFREHFRRGNAAFYPDCRATGHADKDAHDADERRKWRRDRILAASETVGVG